MEGSGRLEGDGLSRFLLAVWPYSGHIHPNLALATALRDRGHEVAFFTGAVARPTVEREGFACFPFRQVALRIRDLLGSPMNAPGKEGDSEHLYGGISQQYTPPIGQGPFVRARRTKAMYREWLLGSIPQQITDLESIFVTWKPDALVCDPFMWGPILVLRERRPTPVVVFSFFAGCLIPGSEIPPFGWGLPPPRDWKTTCVSRLAGAVTRLFSLTIRRQANRIRGSYGLGPVREPVLSFAAEAPLYLVASVPELDYNRRDLPSSVRYVGPCLWDRANTESAPAWLRDLSVDRPLVYVTEGTAHVQEPILLKAAVKALADLPVQVVMTTGKNRDPSGMGLGALPGNMRVERWIPQSALLPHASVVLNQGGSGTALAVLQEGLPQILVPVWWDQFENARRVVESGAGLLLRAGHCTPESLRKTTERVLEEPGLRDKARSLAAALARYGGAEEAADLIVNLESGKGT